MTDNDTGIGFGQFRAELGAILLDGSLALGSERIAVEGEHCRCRDADRTDQACRRALDDLDLVFQRDAIAADHICIVG